MQPIIAFQLPILLSDTLDSQLLTLYLIRSNPNLKPYDPNYLKRKKTKKKKTRKQSSSSSSKINSKIVHSIKPFKSEPSSSSSSSKCKTSTFKLKPDKSIRKSKSNSSSSSSSKPKPPPTTTLTDHPKSEIKSTSFSKILNKSLSTVKSTSQVLSIPSTSSDTSTQCKTVATVKSTKSSKKKSESSSKPTSRNDSTTPTSTSRTQLKSNKKATISNYPSPSPPKPKQLKKIPKEPKASSISSAFGGFKIPKLPATTSQKNNEKNSIPKRLQPSGFSPIDSIIGPPASNLNKSRSTLTSPSRKFDFDENVQSRESQNDDDDLIDPLESDEPELGFDLYGDGEPISQVEEEEEEDFTSQNNDPLIKEDEEEGEGEEAEMMEEAETIDNAETMEEAETMDEAETMEEETIEEIQNPDEESEEAQLIQRLPIKSILDDESESSDEEEEEGNFKRRIAKVNDDGDDDDDDDDGIPLKKRSVRNRITAPKDSSFSVQSRPIPANQQRSTPKVIRSSSSSRQSIPSSLSPLPSPVVGPPPPPPAPTVKSVIEKITKIESPDDAMKKFLEAHELFPGIFANAISRFRNLFRNLLLNLFRDIDFLFTPEKFSILLNEMKKLEMDESYNWEEIISSWGRNYQNLLANEAKSKNMIKVITHIYNHLQSNQIKINLPTAGLLYEMKMVQSD